MNNQEKVLKDFQEVLDRHGYGFQHAILKGVDALVTEGKTKWYLEVVEFPVDLGKGSRVDFILKCPGNRGANPKLILAECKRVNPALANWCFLRAPYIRRGQSDLGYFYESVHYEVEQEGAAVQTKSRCYFDTSLKTYHIALEVKADKTGDAHGGKPQAIEDAATQICVALGGMIELLSQQPHLFPTENVYHLMPVIFTTANLWASEAKLSDADILTGKVDLFASSFKQVDWLVLDYNISPGIKHTVAHSEATRSFGEFMESEYTRSIAIVNPKGLGNFLNWAEKVDLER